MDPLWPLSSMFRLEQHVRRDQNSFLPVGWIKGGKKKKKKAFAPDHIKKQ